MSVNCLQAINAVSKNLKLKDNKLLLIRTRLLCSRNEDDEKSDPDVLKTLKKTRITPRVTKLGFNNGSKYSSGGVRSLRDGSKNSFEPTIIKLPVVPLRGHIFPFFEKLVKKDDMLMSIINNIPPKVPRLALFAIKHGSQFDPKNKDINALYDVGTLASYDTWPQTPNDSPYIVIKSHRRLQRLGLCENQNKNRTDPLLFAECRRIHELPFESTSEIKTICFQIIEMVRKLQHIFPYNSAINELNKRMLNPLYWSYCASDFTMPINPSNLQTILEENDIKTRLKLTVELLGEELHFYNLAGQMNQRIKEMEGRALYLKNLTRMKFVVDNTINNYTQTEDGVDGSEPPPRPTPIFIPHAKPDSFEKKIRDRVKNLVIPPQVLAVIEEELRRLGSIDRSHSEFSVIQSYLENLTLIPWGIYKHHDDVSLEKALEILNEDHFGLKEVKDTIIEHLSVMIRQAKAKGRILCFVGPPGVGKTSIVKSIARAMGREYVRISLGGVDDSVEIKGHRRTYVSSLPGKIIKGLQIAKSMDPVFCIDEVDKLCRNFKGDPSGPLLEAFDPEQNSNFNDHYVDLPCDLSRVFFVCTANTTHTITSPLLDRMEVIKIPGYTSEEKIQIANNFIIPSTVKDFGIEDFHNTRIKIDDPVFKRLTDEYFLEAGVRKLKNCIEKIYRKAIKEITMYDTPFISVNLDNMEKFAGYPDYPIRRPIDDLKEVGVVTGLSASAELSTGFTMDIECDLVPKDKGESSLTATGLAGKSLSESSHVAHLVAKKYIKIIDPNNNSLDNNNARVHFLEGGVEKDGPSAGVAILCALISQAFETQISANLAMTGEITLKGKVLAVGKIQEKVTAALRTGINRVMLPKENENNFNIIDESIKSKLTVHFVENVSDVIKVVFPSLVDHLVETQTAPDERASEP